MKKTSPTYEVIVTCGCNDTDQYAKNAFRILFAHNDYPPISHGSASISQNVQICKIAKWLEKRGKAYAYYFKVDGDSLEAWDLLKGVRVR